MNAAPDALARARDGDRNAMEQLLRENAPLIWSVVRRFFGRAEPDDLFQLGSIGFVKAVRGFDPEYGTCFSTYAVPKIAGEMRRFLRDDGPVKVSRGIREQAARAAAVAENFRLREGRDPHLDELSALTGMSVEDLAVCADSARPPRSLDETVGDEDGASLYELLSVGDNSLIDRLALREALDRLDAQQRQVLFLRYYRDLTQQKTAQLLGLSQVQVSRLESRAMKRLRVLMSDIN